MVASAWGWYLQGVDARFSKHRLAEERSLSYHRAVSRELLRNPDLLEIARARTDAWIAEGGRSAAYALQWRRILDLPLDEIRAFLIERSERAAALRQATPFAGMIPPRERWKIWKNVRADFELPPDQTKT